LSSARRFGACFLSGTTLPSAALGKVLLLVTIAFGESRTLGTGIHSVSETIIRGTSKTPKSQLVTPISTKLQRPDGRDSGQSSVHSRDTISSRPSPASGRNSRPRQIHASPEGLLKQRTHLRLARGPARAGFAEKQPWPDPYANRPYRRSIQCKDRLTPYPGARSSVDKAEVTAVTSQLH
jgi:hypothetical protein